MDVNDLVLPWEGHLAGHFDDRAQPHHHKSAKYLYWFYSLNHYKKLFYGASDCIQQQDFQVHKKIKDSLSYVIQSNYDESISIVAVYFQWYQEQTADIPWS